MASNPAGGDLHVGRSSRFAPDRAGIERGAEDLLGLLGHEEQREPAVGDLGGHGDVLLAQGGHPDRDPGALGVPDDLEGLAQTGALPLGERDLIRHALMSEGSLPGPDLAADVDDLAGPRQWAVVGHSVKPLDDLWSRRTQPEHTSAAREGVDAGSRHGDKGRRPGEDGQDGGTDLDPFGLGGQVSHQAGRVVTVRLRHPDGVEADLLELGYLSG
jgi:hypothetical protein